MFDWKNVSMEGNGLNFKVLSRHTRGWTEENYESRYDNLYSDGIRSGNLPNTSQKRYCLTELARLIIIRTRTYI
jgi:hypothetical protein